MFFLEDKKHHYNGADISGAMSLDYAVTYISYTIFTTIGILAFSYVHQMLSNIRRLGWFIDNKGNPRRWETWRMTTVLLVLRHFCPSASGSSLCWNAHVFSVQKKKIHKFFQRTVSTTKTDILSVWLLVGRDHIFTGSFLLLFMVIFELFFILKGTIFAT